MGSYDSETIHFDRSVGYLSKRIYQLSLAGLEKAFVGENISYRQWVALVSIRYGRGANCTNLARALAHDSGATTRLIDTLEKRELVVRQRDLDDRRVVNLVLTEAGRMLAEQCMVRVADVWSGWLAEWDQADVAQLIHYLQRLRQTLEA